MQKQASAVLLLSATLLFLASGATSENAPPASSTPLPRTTLASTVVFTSVAGGDSTTTPIAKDIPTIISTASPSTTSTPKKVVDTSFSIAFVVTFLEKSVWSTEEWTLIRDGLSSSLSAPRDNIDFEFARATASGEGTVLRAIVHGFPSKEAASNALRVATSDALIFDPSLGETTQASHDPGVYEGEEVPPEENTRDNSHHGDDDKDLKHNNDEGMTSTHVMIIIALVAIGVLAIIVGLVAIYRRQSQAALITPFDASVEGGNPNRRSIQTYEVKGVAWAPEEPMRYASITNTAPIVRRVVSGGPGEVNV